MERQCPIWRRIYKWKKTYIGKFEWADVSKYDGDFYDNNIQGKEILSW